MKDIILFLILFTRALFAQPSIPYWTLDQSLYGPSVFAATLWNETRLVHFDLGPGGALITLEPSDCPYPLSGRMAHTFDGAAQNGRWRNQIHVSPHLLYSPLDLPTIIAHELGHILGLSHIPDPAALMWPWYHSVSGPQPSDIEALKTLDFSSLWP